ncbi:tudor domain-containing 6 [Antennarius striatus]|uniref:tudor domain-containing 6 n=1 Tax=Antennarius striatus TaxID=241820 RepID=UPI0035AFDA95
MSSIEVLPNRGSETTVLIKKVHLHPLCVLVEFWGKFSELRTADYECLAKEIQSPRNTFGETEGNPGDQCLVQVEGTWYRSRIVSRNGSKYTVFLIDKGMSYSTVLGNLAWGKKQHFSLPPEVEHCVLANVLPLSPDNRWSPVALEFLKSLSGKSVKAHVQDVLVQQRTFVLKIHCISKQMYEMGMAKKLSPDVFQDFVHMSNTEVEVSPETLQISTGAGELLHKEELFMYPELPEGTVETVIVTEVTNPQRIFCQLKVFSKELKKLSEQITKRYEGRTTNCIISPEMIGFPCAARGRDGKWYRSVVQQVFPACGVVEVLNVDYGTKEFVCMMNVKPLDAEFFRMPVVTYICSLYGITENGVGWTNDQVEYLVTLLLHKTVIVKFEYQSISEGVHYVTLYGEENANINTLFGSKESCLLDYVKAFEHYAIQSSACSHINAERNLTTYFTHVEAAEEKVGKGRAEKLPVEEMSVSSSYVATVQHVIDPSEFWIQTQHYAHEFDELMEDINDFYKGSSNNGLRNPSVGMYCAAKAEDGYFYRATVAEITETKAKVFFVDYGNTEVVDQFDIKSLPDKFKKLPCFAVKCFLAGVRPKDGRWSQSSCNYFKTAVTDKILNVYVTEKCEDSYAVQLLDSKAEGEKDVRTLMCSSGLAERAETQRQLKPTTAKQPAVLCKTQLPETRLSSVSKKKEITLQPQKTSGSSGDERRTPSFKEYMFTIGRVLDVTVSCINSPNDFWCQLVQNAGHLKLLMHNLQTYYANSEFEPFVETACVARHPHNRMWYRALVIHKHETHVDVLFVDYGQTEAVSLYDLRKICPEFLILRGQAFRCSLLNPADPTSATNKWNDEAIAKFYSFVEMATSKFIALKCTIYAIMYSEQKIVFNIVALETPFESIATSMMNLVQGSSPMTVTGPSFRLDTYYYSTHHVKTGTEEEVLVTCVNSVSQFYCQLERNADVIKNLKEKVNSICHKLVNVTVPTVFGTLCFAKYTDGQWYRGQIKTTKPVIKVHFVDYGDTIEVEKSDLLPIPKEANNIMSVPVQAVMCSLSDIPEDVCSKVNHWFEMNATDCRFQALIVAREPDGKLLVELYHGKTQINSQLKKMSQVEMHREEQILQQGRIAFKGCATQALKTPIVALKKAAETKDHNLTFRKNDSNQTPAHEIGDSGLSMQTAKMPLSHVCENAQKVKAAPLKLYKPPHQRQACESAPDKAKNGSEVVCNIKSRKESLFSQTKELFKTTSSGRESLGKNDAASLPKLSDLPSKDITSGMEADVYVSHCNSPLSFYVQLVKEEDEIFSLVDKLNNPLSIPLTLDITDLQTGDLVQAEFPDDSSWYRAFVKEIHNNMTVIVEFVDFGNTTTLPISKIARLDKYFLDLPAYSIHCMLSDAVALGMEEVSDPTVMSSFKEDIGGNGEKVLKCQFIKQSGSIWEVILEDGVVNVICKVSARCTTDDVNIIVGKIEQAEEKPGQTSDTGQMSENTQEPTQNNNSHNYRQQEVVEGQTLEGYITAVNDNLTFCCQPVDSEEFVKLTSVVSAEVGDADHKWADPDTLTPGRPCIALFSDNRSWRRAEVIHKDGDMLSVRFVDYGNISQVSVTDVMEMPTHLMETPPKAILCELQGFGDSCGSWDRGAVDHFSVMTADKVLQLTITGVAMEGGQLKSFVHVEYEGQVINEAMKTWWKTSMTEVRPGVLGSTTSYKPNLQCQPGVKDTAPPKDQLEYTESHETGTAVDHFQPRREHNDEQSDDKLFDFKTAEVPEVACSYYEDSTVDFPGEKRDSIDSEDSLITEIDLPRMTEMPKYTDSKDVNIVSLLMVSDDSDIEEYMFLPLERKGDTDILNISCDKIEMETDGSMQEEGDSVMDPVGSDPLRKLLDESLVENLAESLVGEVHTDGVEGSFDVTHFSDPEKWRDLERIVEESIFSCTSAAKMVPREEACPRVVSKDLKLVELCVLKSVNVIIDSLPEQDIDATNGILKEAVSCVATQFEHEVMAEETLDYQEDVLSVLPADHDTAYSGPQVCTDPILDLVYGVGGLIHNVEEAGLTDICTGADEPTDDAAVSSATDDCHLSEITEELILNESLLPCGDPPHKLIIAQPHEAEPQTNTDPCPDFVNLVEEVTSLVRQISLTDDCRDAQHSKTEESDQLVHTPSPQAEDFGSGELEEDLLLADDFEAQLTSTTHLSLKINDWSADTLTDVQQKE